MLFKLISDGERATVEIDGKQLGNSMTGVSFSYKRDGKETQVLAHIDLDLSRTHEKRFVRNATPGFFASVNESYEETEYIRKQRQIATDAAERQLLCKGAPVGTGKAPTEDDG